MIAVGRHLASIVHGDRYPAALYRGGHLIGGAVIAVASGTGQVDLGEQPYQAALPQVKVYGRGVQRGIPAPQAPICPEFVEGAALTDGSSVARLPVLRAMLNGSVWDEITLPSGEVLRQVGEQILTGEEPWSINQYAHGLGVNIYQTQASERPADQSVSLLPISTHFTGRLWSTIYDIRDAVNAVYAPSVICIKTDGKQSLESFVDWLKQQNAAGTPVKVWYALKKARTERADPVILRQRPGHTVLTQKGGKAAEIEAKYYKEVK